MSTHISKKCIQCSKNFPLPKKEYNRRIKNGRDPNKFFCSLSCSATWVNTHLTEEQQENRIERIKKYQVKGPSHPSTKGIFTEYLNRVRQRSKSKNQLSDLTEEYLKDIWNKQNGKCAITNVPIQIADRFKKVRMKPDTASLDRIDSSLPYIIGNVQFLAASINLAKNTFSDNEIKEFLLEVKKTI